MILAEKLIRIISLSGPSIGAPAPNLIRTDEWKGIATLLSSNFLDAWTISSKIFSCEILIMSVLQYLKRLYPSFKIN